MNIYTFICIYFFHLFMDRYDVLVFECLTNPRLISYEISYFLWEWNETETPRDRPKGYSCLLLKKWNGQKNTHRLILPFLFLDLKIISINSVINSLMLRRWFCLLGNCVWMMEEKQNVSFNWLHQEALSSKKGDPLP